MNKTILITGGAGFIAHHVIDKILATTDWNIVTLDRLDFSGNLNRLNEVVMSHDSNHRSRVRVIHHDLKSEINLEKVVSKYNESTSNGILMYEPRKIEIVNHSGNKQLKSFEHVIHNGFFFLPKKSKFLEKQSFTSSNIKLLF